MIDKRGDMDNIKYGEIERSRVPEYHRSGGKCNAQIVCVSLKLIWHYLGGLIIGLPTSQKIDIASAKSGKVLKIVSASSRKVTIASMDKRGKAHAFGFGRNQHDIWTLALHGRNQANGMSCV